MSNPSLFKRDYFPSASITFQMHLPCWEQAIIHEMLCIALVVTKKALVTTRPVLTCSRTVRRLFWYLLSAIFCIWSVMILKHLDLESSRFFGLLLLSVSISCNTWSVSQHMQLVHPCFIASAFALCGHARAISQTMTWSSGGHRQLR